MKCRTCGGLVLWEGPISNLTHTKCQQCGAVDNQEPEPDVQRGDPDDTEGGDTE